MAVTETTTVSWGSRLGSAIKGVLVGIALFLLAFPLLFWNEGNYIKTLRALEEGEKSVVAVASDAVNAEMEGKLVYTSGLADTQDVLTDSEFGISETAIRLSRKVEMYQWVEERHTETKKNVGGSETRTTTYTYNRKWSDSLCDSSNFKEPGHNNPSSLPYTKAEQLATKVTLGAFMLSESQISRIGSAKPFEFPSDYVFKARSGSRVMNGTTIYIPANGQFVESEPQIGDVRVTFSVIKPHSISLVAKQFGDTFTAYTASNGKSISLLQDGVVDAAELFATAKSDNAMLTWLLRLVGFLMMYFGLSMVFKPISVLADVLPILGDLVGVGIGLVSFLIAAPCTLITIAIGWLFYRPLIGVPLLAVSLWLIWMLFKKRAAKKKAAASSAVPTAAAALALCCLLPVYAAEPKPELPVADYEKLILAYKDATFNKTDYYRIDSQSAASKAFNDARKNFTLPKATFLENTLKNESPLVRARSVELLSGSFFGTSLTSRDRAVALMAEEKDAGVRAALLRTFSNDGGKNPAIGSFILAALNDPDPVIRETAVVFCTSSWNAKVPGFVEKLADLIVNEPDAKVRSNAAQRAGKLGEALLVPAYEKALKDADEKVARSALRGLLDMWWAFPMFNTANADAYKLMLATLGELKADKSLSSDYFTFFGSLGMFSTMPKTRETWAKNTAGFYKAEEVRAALMPFVESTTVNFLIRNNAFKALFAHGMSKDDLQALAEKLKPNLPKFDANALDNALKQLK